MPDQPLRIVIVGGVAGGASAAARARRCSESAEIILLERDGDVSFGNCGMPYFIGGEISDRRKLLVASAELLRKRFRIDVRTHSEVTSVNRTERTVQVACGNGEETYELPWDRLILSPGARPVGQNIPGAQLSGVHTLRSLSDMDRIHAAITAEAQQAVIVVGAGMIGLEMTEQLVRRGCSVKLVEASDQVLPLLDREMSFPIAEELRAAGVEIHCGQPLQQIDGTQQRTTGVTLQDGTTLSGSFVLLGIGVRPETQLAVAANLELGPSGGILTNEFQQTSDPEIYAAGDACEYRFGPANITQRISLAGPATRAGRLAGEHAVTGRASPAAAVMGTAILRVFHQTAACTGLSVRQALQMGILARSVTVLAASHAGYYPGATQITLKLVFAPDTGRILGAQAVGKQGIDKRIDVISTAMSLQGTVRDLAGLDLTYAPPFGSARDPIHQAAFTACNELDGFGAMLDADADLAGWQVVDVRSAGEIEQTPLTECDEFHAIPVDELRERLHELDPARPTVVSCGVGIRAHTAQRILLQHGFATVLNLSGGAALRRRAIPPQES